MSRVRHVRGGVAIRVAYPYSLDFFDQLSCIKFFHRSYGLKDIDFLSFIKLNQLLDFFYYLIPTLSKTVMLTGSTLTSGATLSLAGAFNWSN